MKTNLKIIIALLTSILFQSITRGQEYRYTKTLFSNAQISEDIVYQNAPFIDSPYNIEINTTNQDLKMDIFTPEGDTNENRPAIIFAHSGGFLLGNKNHDDIMAFCDSLSNKGYVTATIDYRLGFNIITNPNMHATRAVYRGIQDGMAAVRYLRANADTYNIDATKVYFIGSSAGSFIGLHSIYMDNDELPSDIGAVSYVNITVPFNHTAPDLGPLNIGDNLNFNGQPDAVVALWGAVQNTNLIHSNNDTPVFLIHGGNDSVVSFEIGSPFEYPVLNDTYGSNEINNKLEELELTNKETYFIPEGEHEFYGTDNGTWSNGYSGNEYWDILLEKITTFLWEQHKPNAEFDYEQQGNGISTSPETVVFYDQSFGATSWLWDFGDGNTSTEQNPIHTYNDLGIYQVTLYIENDILSWDEKIIEINTSLSTTENEVAGFSFFPNPTKDELHFSFDNYYPSIKIELYDIKSQLIQTKKIYNLNNFVFNLKNIAKGIYFIKVSIDKHIQTIKILKQ
tara:strand:+ start:2785 stop:4314 length:1530 start_codon:yes stop_codon:yes gene_type:complete